MDFKGTKGTWLQSHRKGLDGMYNTEVYTEENPKEVICTLGWYPNHEVEGVTSTYREANAKLIAAAPELLNALEDAITGLEWEISEKGGAGYDKAGDEKLLEWKELINRIL